MDIIPIHINTRVGKSCETLLMPLVSLCHVCLREKHDSERHFLHGVHSFRISETKLNSSQNHIHMYITPCVYVKYFTSLLLGHSDVVKRSVT